MVGRRCVFIPLQAYSGNFGNVQQAVLYIVGLLQNGIGPVLPLEPVRGLRHSHHVCGDLWIEKIMVQSAAPRGKLVSSIVRERPDVRHPAA